MGVMMVLKKLVDGDRLIVADDCGNNYWESSGKVSKETEGKGKWEVGNGVDDATATWRGAERGKMEWQDRLEREE